MLEKEQTKMSVNIIFTPYCISFDLSICPHSPLSLSIYLSLSLSLSIYLSSCLLCAVETVNLVQLIINKSFSFIFINVFMDSKKGLPQKDGHMALALRATNKSKFSLCRSMSVSLLQYCRKLLVHEDLWKLVHHL